MVANNIRGKKVVEALNILKYTKKEGGEWLEKLLLSAVANWEYKQDMMYSADEYELIVKTIFVDEGTMLKAFSSGSSRKGAPYTQAYESRNDNCREYGTD